MKTRQQELIEMIMSRDQSTANQAIINVPMKLRREAQRKRLNATCIHCNGDVLDQLCKAANDWAGYGPPASRTFECPHCEEELEFELGWETALCWAKPVVEEPEP